MDAGKGRLLWTIILLPGNAVVLIPAVLFYLEGRFVPGWFGGGAAQTTMLIAGAGFICLGLSVAKHTASLFMKYGEGTPAPWDPPRRLVVRGAYRYVRNPMIMSVLSMLIGESILTGSRYIAWWSLLFFVANHIYFIVFEEPGLLRRFGDGYLLYRRNVPRWIPRTKPYKINDCEDRGQNVG